jgi:protein phosphatase
MQVKAWCKSDVGLKREQNQDSCLIDEALGLYIVADGMGGHRGGEVASRLAVEAMSEVVAKARRDSGKRRPNLKTVMSDGYEEASRRIFDASQAPDSDLYGMGTTLVVACREGDHLTIGNVGDSRAYLFTRGCLWQMTEDHSLVAEQLRAGLLTEEEISKVTPRNVITRSVGFEREVQPDILEYMLKPGDLVLMCSDGLSGLVSDGEIAELCRGHKAEELADVCIEAAKKAGGDDNVTVLVIKAD